MSRTAKIVGHQNVDARVEVEDVHVSSVVLGLKNERVRELEQILDRALNCWPEGPAWAFELSDALKTLTPKAGV
jgi:hypothetical protein